MQKTVSGSGFFIDSKRGGWRIADALTGKETIDQVKFLVLSGQNQLWVLTRYLRATSFCPLDAKNVRNSTIGSDPKVKTNFSRTHPQHEHSC